MEKGIRDKRKKIKIMIAIRIKRKSGDQRDAPHSPQNPQSAIRNAQLPSPSTPAARAAYPPTVLCRKDHDRHCKIAPRTGRAAQREPRLPAAQSSGRRRAARGGFPGRHRRAGRAGRAFPEDLHGRANLLVRLSPAKKTRQRVLLAPHLDTVPAAAPDQFKPRAKNGRLHGRGACDTKGSVAAMFTALVDVAHTRRRPQETEIIFAGLLTRNRARPARARWRPAASRRTSPSWASRPGCRL